MDSKKQSELPIDDPAYEPESNMQALMQFISQRRYRSTNIKNPTSLRMMAQQYATVMEKNPSQSQLIHQYEYRLSAFWDEPTEEILMFYETLDKHLHAQHPDQTQNTIGPASQLIAEFDRVDPQIYWSKKVVHVKYKSLPKNTILMRLLQSETERLVQTGKKCRKCATYPQRALIPTIASCQAFYLEYSQLFQSQEKIKRLKDQYFPQKKQVDNKTLSLKSILKYFGISKNLHENSQKVRIPRHPIKDD